MHCEEKFAQKNSQANEPQPNDLAREAKLGGMTMVLNRQFLQSVSAAVLIAASVPLASAQQTIAPQSATPVPGPVPEILQLSLIHI